MGQLPHDRSGWRALLRHISRVTRDPQNAEDHLHTAFLRLREYSRGQQVENPTGFLVRAAVNLSMDTHRQTRTRLEHATHLVDRFRLEQSQPLQDEVLEARERLAAVRAALDQLPPKTREIFLLHRVEGLKYREIAERRGITMSAVEKHIARAALHLMMTFEGRRSGE